MNPSIAAFHAVQYLTVPRKSGHGADTILAKQCIPSNDLISGPITPVLKEIEGALGGVLFGIVIFMVIALTVTAVILVLSKRGPALLQAIAKVLVIPLLIIVALIAWTGIYVGLNSLCT